MTSSQPSALPSTGSTSSSLLARVLTRAPGAWERLAQLYGPLVYGWARRAGLQDTDAADVVQEVFCAVAAGLPAFHHDRPGDSFRGWLYGITRNKLADHFRRRASFPDARGGTDAQEQLLRALDPPEPEADSSRAVGGDLLRRALALLRCEFEERTWQAFWYSAIDGRATADVAGDLGMNVRAVRQAKYRVLRRLREELGQGGAG